jgi:hypothetical protein
MQRVVAISSGDMDIGGTARRSLMSRACTARLQCEKEPKRTDVIYKDVAAANGWLFGAILNESTTRKISVHGSAVL